GFDYTIMMYGGSNVTHLDMVEDPEEVVGFDLLALCRNAIVVVDSDFAAPPNGAPEAQLKPAVKAMISSSSAINRERHDATLVVWTQGREVENYLPDEAVRFAVRDLAEFSKDEERAACLPDLSVGQYERYFEVVESHLTGRQVIRRFKGN